MALFDIKTTNGEKVDVVDQEPGSKHTDPTHPDNASSTYTTKEGIKPEDGITAILDPDFIPTLDESVPTIRWIQSSLVLAVILFGGIGMAYWAGWEIFQEKSQSLLVIGAIIVSIFYSGVHYIDFWELVVNYWWFSLPLSGCAGIFYVLMEESGNGMADLD